MNEPSLVAVLRYIADESILIGGTLARYASSGVKVSIVYLIDELEDHTPELYVGRSLYTAQLQAAHRILGITQTTFSCIKLRECLERRRYFVVDRIAGAYRRFRPQAIITYGTDASLFTDQ